MPIAAGVFTGFAAFMRNAPLWEVALVGISGALAGVAILVLLYRLFLYQNQAPARKSEKKLLFSAGPNKGMAPNPSQSYGQICWWYRLEVTTEWPEGVKGCMGRLLRIRKGHQILFDKDEAILTFAPGENTDTTAKFIYPKAPFHLDLFYITSQNEIKIAVVGRRWRYLRSAKGSAAKSQSCACFATFKSAHTA
ncbi:MAG TPA: hypothetical protein VG838_02045 [Opitutaceae bacterium]|nr:hypothetical protein [Opitutaceae bacterium]